MCIAFFFFKQKTAYEMRISDWSSDVCSSDLHAVHGRQELVHVGDAVLEQVADPGGVVGEEVGRVALLHVLRQHEDAELGPARTDLHGGTETVVGHRRLHPDVNQREDGLGSLAATSQPGCTARRGEGAQTTRTETG